MGYDDILGGRIEVITGPMFAGKSEELIRRINRLKYAKKNFLVFKPLLDDRYSETEVVSHRNRREKSIPISKPEEIYNYLKENTEVICIDEVQFFDEKIIDIIDELANKGLRIIVSGLDTDFKGNPRARGISGGRGTGLSDSGARHRDALRRRGSAYPPCDSDWFRSGRRGLYSGRAQYRTASERQRQASGDADASARSGQQPDRGGA